MWTSTERLYLDSNGQVCKEDNPDRQTLLCAAGGKIPLARAKELGLVASDHPTKNAGMVSANETPAYLELQSKNEKLERDFDVLKGDHSKYKNENVTLVQQIGALNAKITEAAEKLEAAGIDFDFTLTATETEVADEAKADEETKADEAKADEAEVKVADEAKADEETKADEAKADEAEVKVEVNNVVAMGVAHAMEATPKKKPAKKKEGE